MTPEEKYDLLSRYLDDTLGEADGSALDAHLRSDPDFARTLCELSLQHALLHRLGRTGRVGATESDMALPAVPRPKARHRLWARSPSSSSSLLQIWIPVAACAAIVLALIAYTSGGPSTPPRTPEARTRPEPSPAPPPPEPRPAPVSAPKRVEASPAPKEPAPETPKVIETTPPKPEVPPPALPAPKPEEPRPAPPKEPATTVTEKALATIEKAEGDVALPGGAAKAGQPVAPGQGIRVGPTGLAVVRFADGTRVELGPDTVVTSIAGDGGKKVALDRGVVTGQVTKQAAGQPMVFSTPHAEARVLGTRLTLWVRAEWTRLEVKEGKVRLTRLSDGAFTDVSAAQFAIAAPGPKPVARRLPATAVKGALFADDFEDPLGVESRWQALEGGFPTTSRGVLDVDLSPRPNESYAAGGWHNPGGLRSRQNFPLPLRISMDVEQTQKHLDVNALVVFVPKGQAPGVTKDEVAVRMRGTGYGILVQGQPAKSLDVPWTAPVKERWTVELDRQEVRFLVDGKLILRHAHGLQAAEEYRLELQAAGKLDAPPGTRVRFDNVRVEP